MKEKKGHEYDRIEGRVYRGSDIWVNSEHNYVVIHRVHVLHTTTCIRITALNVILCTSTIVMGIT